MRSRRLNASLSPLATWGAVVAGALASGCSAITERLGARELRNADTSGQYGLMAEISSTVASVKAKGATRLMGSHAVRLPSPLLDPISSYEYQYPMACGAYVFRVLESSDTQILEYSHLRQDGTVFVIRDYLAGPSPFIAPGLWTSYDHTSQDIPEMMARYIETASRLTPRIYSAGPVTGLATMTQQELGLAYREALDGASRCATE